MSYQAALAFVLEREGGYRNIPGDPGGPTNRGVTQRNYDRWRRAQGLPVRDVRDLTTEETADFYEAEYWRLGWADRVEEAGHGCLALCHVDWSVHGGVPRARRYLQLVCGTAPDGAWGPKTRDAIRVVDQHVAVARYQELRALHFWGRVGDEWAREELGRRGVPSAVIPAVSRAQRRELKGWLARLRAVARETGTPIAPTFARGADGRATAPREGT